MSKVKTGTSIPYRRVVSSVKEKYGRETLFICEQGGDLKVNGAEALNAGIPRGILIPTNNNAYDHVSNPGGRSCGRHSPWSDSCIKKAHVEFLGGECLIKTLLDEARHKKFGVPFFR